MCTQDRSEKIISDWQKSSLEEDIDFTISGHSDAQPRGGNRNPTILKLLVIIADLLNMN